MCYIVLAAARIVKGPENVGAHVGSTVQLKCMFHHRSCKDIIWTRVEQSGSTAILYVGGRMQRTADGRYDHYNVNVVRGECTLSINELMLRDGGTFTCTETGDAVSDRSKKAATITVIGMCVYICVYTKCNKKVIPCDFCCDNASAVL